MNNSCLLNVLMNIVARQNRTRRDELCLRKQTNCCYMWARVYIYIYFNIYHLNILQRINVNWNIMDACLLFQRMKLCFSILKSNDLAPNIPRIQPISHLPKLKTSGRSVSFCMLGTFWEFVISVSLVVCVCFLLKSWVKIVIFRSKYIPNVY